MGCSSSFLPFQEYSEIIRVDSVHIVESRSSSSRNSEKTELSPRKVHWESENSEENYSSRPSSKLSPSLTSTESQHEETLQELRQISKLLIFGYGNSLRGNNRRDTIPRERRRESIRHEPRSSTHFVPMRSPQKLVTTINGVTDVGDIMGVVK